MLDEGRDLDPRARKLRTGISAALLVAGTVAFATSMALPAVTKIHMRGRTINVDGWTCATHYGPTAVTNGFLAVAFVFWAAAVWFRSRIAWGAGVALSIAAACYHPIIGAWPGYEGIQRLYSGYWTWSGATSAICASFLILPRPLREPGERLSRDETDRGRAALAWSFGTAAGVVLLGSHLLLPTSVGQEWREGWPQRGDRFGGYQSGPTRSEMDPATKTVGRVDEVGYQYGEMHRRVDVLGTAVEHQMQDSRRSSLEFALLILPLLLLAAATTRRAAWRWSGAAVAVIVTTACPFMDSPWPGSGIVPLPLDVVWWVTPGLFVVAFLVIPPIRAEAGVTPSALASVEPRGASAAS